tara:strand:- start:179 stop:544 length:366 start_codon:yes stop_codon:yes gene_type:complete
MDYELQAITEAAIELVKDQDYAIICELNEESGDYVVREWGEGVTPPSDSDLATKRAEKLAIITYQNSRLVGTATTAGYPIINAQLDQLYHDIDAGKFGSDAKTGDWFVGISSIKSAFPKPS